MTTVNVKLLHDAAERVNTDFRTVPTSPVRIDDLSRISPSDLMEIRQRYVGNGFGVIELANDEPTPDALTRLGEALGLSEPFIPPLYRTGGKEPEAVSRISAARNAGTSDADHPSFGSTAGQSLHTDGTLQDIGLVKASLLLCETAAAEGGDTILFNTSAAIAALLNEDPAAVLALATPGTLVRRATINGSVEANHGSLCAVLNGSLVCRYSVTATDSWAYPDDVDRAALDRGIAWLTAHSRKGNEFFLQFKLAPGHAIVFDNTRVSHGRTPYRDSGESHRNLYRALFLEHPQEIRATVGGELP
ncbi:TauD/TfdA family dioxygenase [Amycolatopsis sp. NPDC051102]|uniref:TauD/TfdA family dioxygenase n=1 Tax=Amycolatopsis sp. NPDC051102 TaxID=3155163 RepID=UPI003423E348